MKQFGFSFPSLSSIAVTLYVSAIFTLIFNLRIEVTYLESYPLNGITTYIAAFAFYIFIFLLTVFLFSLFGFKYLQKPFVIIMFLISAPSLYFSLQFNTLFDETMLTNALETDAREAGDLLTHSFWLMFIFLAVLPSIIIYKTPIRYKSFWRTSISNIALMSGSLILTILVIAPFYGKFSSFVRNNNIVLKNSFLPYAPIHALYKSLRHKNFNDKVKPVILDRTAKIKSSQTHKKPLALIVMVGETARASSFSSLLKELSNQDDFINFSENLFYFENVTSCGTNTAASLPCMFSTYTRSTFEREYNITHENIAETIYRVGYDVQWTDNNSGCKGVCNHIPTTSTNQPEDNLQDSNEHYFDDLLVKDLKKSLTVKKTDQIVFLHQMGSHGPAYFKRSPQAFKLKQPSCQSKDFGRCSQQEIVNAYENSIIYTNHIIAKTINSLQQIEKKYDTALIYISDHGESTGEGGYYLHGLPYFIAPKEQTHVPMLMWFSNGFSDRVDLDLNCLKQKTTTDLSHDNLSHSLLGLLDIETTDYALELDLFASCRK